MVVHLLEKGTVGTFYVTKTEFDKAIKRLEDKNKELKERLNSQQDKPQNQKSHLNKGETAND